jgi:DNA-binding MarR family transcriptional regulator
MPASFIGYWFSVAAQHYYQRLKDKLAHLAISDWSIVLVTIQVHNGRLSQQQLADLLHLDKVTISRALDHLGKGGHIERCDCAGDRRKHLVRTTPKAAHAVKEIRKTYRSLNKVAMHSMSARDHACFQGQLATMAADLRHVNDRTVSITKRIKA